MNDRTIVRRLILAQLACWVTAGIVNEFHLHSLPESTRRIVDPDLFVGMNPAIMWPLAVIALVTMIFSYVALYRFRPGSGRLFLWVNGVGLLLGFVMPPTYGSGVAASLEFLGTTFFGMTVAWILLGRVPYVDGAAVATSATAQRA